MIDTVKSINYIFKKFLLLCPYFFTVAVFFPPLTFKSQGLQTFSVLSYQYRSIVGFLVKMWVSDKGEGRKPKLLLFFIHFVFLLTLFCEHNQDMF